MNSFRKSICTGCHKEFTYTYKGGRPRKFCPDCKARKKSKPRYNAYGTQCFYGIPLPRKWRFARNGSGNIVRWLWGQFITLYDKHGVFAVVITSRSKNGKIWRESAVTATPKNAPQGIAWAEEVTKAVVRTYSAK